MSTVNHHKQIPQLINTAWGKALHLYVHSLDPGVTGYLVWLILLVPRRLKRAKDSSV